MNPNLILTRIRSAAAWLVMLFTAFFLVSCGGGGGGGSSANAPTTTTATVTAFKGMYSQMTVTVTDANRNPVALLNGTDAVNRGTTTSSVPITYSVNVVYPLTVSVTGSYTDETANPPAQVTTTVPLRGFAVDAAGAASGIAVTGVTEIAAALLNNLTSITATSVNAALASTGSVLGMTGTQPSAVPKFANTLGKITDPTTLKLAALAFAANTQGTGTNLVARVSSLATQLTVASGVSAVIGSYNNAIIAVNGGASSVLPTSTISPPNIPPVAVPQPIALLLPTVTISAGSNSIPAGTQTLITWSSTNSNSCQFLAGPGIPPGIGTSGNFTTPALTSSTTYTVSCTGPLGTSLPMSATVAIKPTATLTATSTSIAYGATTTLNWSSTYSDSCQFTAGTNAGAPSGATLAASGGFTTTSLSSNTTYALTCTGPGGTVSQSTLVTVTPPPQPTATLTLSTPAISSGMATTLTWSSTNSDSCQFTGGTGAPAGAQAPSGHFNTSALIGNTTYTLTCTGPGGTSVQQNAAVTVSGTPCSTSGATGSITWSMVPARLSGVAPLAVFFDATGTTATATTRPFHELEYRWGFGDPTSGTWANGARPGSSKNAATGPVAAHVFETPGIYYVSLGITDGTNTVSNACTQITVDDPNVVFAGANTVCVSGWNSPTKTTLSPPPVAGQNGCPANDPTAGATVVAQQPSFSAAINTYAKTGKRVLFQRGDTFAGTTAALLTQTTQTGPGIIGSFGVGPLPVIQMAASNPDGVVLAFSSCLTPTFGDWRVMDLEMDGMDGASAGGVGAGGGITQITALRLTLKRFSTALGLDSSAANGYNNVGIVPGLIPCGPKGHVVDQTAVVDSTVVYGVYTGNSSYMSGNRMMYMGNEMDNGGNQQLPPPRLTGDFGSHITRFPYLGKAVISNNTFARPGGSRLAIKLHGPTFTNGLPDPTFAGGGNYSAAVNGDGWTKEVIISDNRLVSYIEPWSIAVSPQSVNYDERIRDVILERNLHVGNPTDPFWGPPNATNVAQVIRSRDTTIRNNIFLNVRFGVQIEVDGAELPAKNIWVYNNTYYSNTAFNNGQSGMVHVRQRPNLVWAGVNDNPASNFPSNITIKNNLAYAPGAPFPPSLYFNEPNQLTYPALTDVAMNIVVSNNSTDTQVANVAPFTVPGAGVYPSLVPPYTIPAGFLNNFIPTPGSYAINAGATGVVGAPNERAPVWSDLFGSPASGVPDIGAIAVP